MEDSTQQKINDLFTDIEFLKNQIQFLYLIKSTKSEENQKSTQILINGFTKQLYDKIDEVEKINI
jgi:hypothetical protein